MNSLLRSSFGFQGSSCFSVSIFGVTPIQVPKTSADQFPRFRKRRRARRRCKHEDRCLDAWKDWRNDPEQGALALVRAAILAASPHNTQPWLFKVTNSSIELYIDAKRNVGALDPDHEKALGNPALRASLLAEVMGDAVWQPTFVFYMGYPKWIAQASPRRSIESVIL